ncbi:MAG: ROK family transcriptional regulator [Ekhidna sp.]|nr:ROK family transcriptional regulator [Ekhidna sp.]
MKHHFLKNDGSVLDKRTRQQMEYIRILSKMNKAMTIPEIAEAVQTSIPTATTIITDLLENNWILIQGKRETGPGRNPAIYSVNTEQFYAIGLIIGLKKAQLVIININQSEVYKKSISDFNLENTKGCLNQLVDFVSACIKEFEASISKVLGLGVGITGRVNVHTGETLNYFNFMEVPFKQYLEARLKIPVHVENDTRITGFTECEFGKGKGSDNIILINLDRGLGLSMVVNGKLLLGNSGFAGEFGHMKFGTKERLCICGKKGCLGTEVSGYALQLDFEEALSKGCQSLLLKEDQGEISFFDILEGANNGDLTSIDLIQAQGLKLGEALGSILNLLNPKDVIVGGSFVVVNDLLLDAIKVGLKKTCLPMVMKECRIMLSELSANMYCRGAASLVLKSHDLI